MKDYIGYKHGFRSNLEDKISKQLEGLGINGEYEQHKLKFVQPAENRAYTPDFWLRGPKGLICIESKGLFTAADRKKHLMVKDCHPDLDLRFVFTNPNGKIYKGSKTTYATWCDKYEFKYAKGLIPLAWIEEVGL